MSNANEVTIQGLADIPLVSIESARARLEASINLGLDIRRELHSKIFLNLANQLKVTSGKAEARREMLVEVLSYNKQLGFVRDALDKLIPLGESLQTQIRSLDNKFIQAAIEHKELMAQLAEEIETPNYPQDAKIIAEEGLDFLKLEYDTDPVLIRGRQLLLEKNSVEQVTEETVTTTTETETLVSEKGKKISPYDDRVNILKEAVFLMHEDEVMQSEMWEEVVINGLIRTNTRKSTVADQLNLPLDVRVKRAMNLLIQRGEKRYPSHIEKLRQAATSSNRTDEEHRFYEELKNYKDKGLITGDDDVSRMASFEKVFAEWINNRLTKAKKEDNVTEQEEQENVVELVVAAAEEMSTSAESATEETAGQEGNTFEEMIDLYAALPSSKDKEKERGKYIRGKIQEAIDNVLAHIHVFVGKDPISVLTQQTIPVGVLARDIRGITQTDIVSISHKGIIGKIRKDQSVSNHILDIDEVIIIVAYQKISKDKGLFKSELRQLPKLVKTVIEERIAELKESNSRRS